MELSTPSGLCSKLFRENVSVSMDSILPPVSASFFSGMTLLASSYRPLSWEGVCVCVCIMHLSKYNSTYPPAGV